MAMNLNLNKLPWYGQIGLFVGLSLAGAGVFWNFYAVKAREEIDARKLELAKIRAEGDKGLATARRLPQFRRDVAQLQADLERLRSVLPEEKDVADLLRRIQGMATQSNLTIRGFTPRAVASKQMHAEWPIGLQLEGTYHDLGAFLERVSKFPRIINVNGIKIKPLTEKGAGATITAECTATTFVMIDAARPATPVATAGTPVPPPSN